MLGRPNARKASRTSAVPYLGFRRVSAVRAWTGDGATRFEVDGVVHRRLVTRTVSARIAAALVAAGAPLVVRDAPDTPRAAGC